MKFLNTKFVSSTACIMLLAACSSQSDFGDEQLALIAQATPESRAELLRVLKQANNGVAVTVADDALVHESQLILQQGPINKSPSRPLTGRDLGRPQVFQLLLNERGCWLQRAEDKERWHLQRTICKPQISVIDT